MLEWPTHLVGRLSEDEEHSVLVALWRAVAAASRRPLVFSPRQLTNVAQAAGVSLAPLHLGTRDGPEFLFSLQLQAVRSACFSRHLGYVYVEAEAALPHRAQPLQVVLRRPARPTRDGVGAPVAARSPPRPANASSPAAAAAMRTPRPSPRPSLAHQATPVVASASGGAASARSGCAESPPPTEESEA